MDIGPHRCRIALPEVSRHSGAVCRGKYECLGICNGSVERCELKRFVTDSRACLQGMITHCRKCPCQLEHPESWDHQGLAEEVTSTLEQASHEDEQFA